MQETEHKIKIISDLLAPFGKVGNGDGKAVLRGYLDAVEHIAPMFVAEAARRLLTGETQRGNPAFAPSPTELALEARKVFEADRRLHQPALPEPEPEPVDEAMKARISARMEALAAELRPPKSERAVLDTTPSEAIERLHQLQRTAKQRTVTISPELRTQLTGDAA